MNFFTENPKVRRENMGNMISVHREECNYGRNGSGPYGLPEAIAILFIVFLHKWKKNTLLSIGGGNDFVYAVGAEGVLECV